jgi:hypothetical protein
LSARPTAEQLLERPRALLTRSHLRELGWGRADVDRIFRSLPVVVLERGAKPHIWVADYLDYVSANTYRDDRVRPT